MISRRNFLKVSALAGGGLMISVMVPACIKSNSQLKESTEKDVELGKFLTIDSRGKITFILTKHEMGQGSGTGLPMIFADELGADWSKVVVKRSDYNNKFDDYTMGITGGSSSIVRTWKTLRETAASVREILRRAASEIWREDINTLKVENSFVINTLTGEKLEFGELAEAASKLPFPDNVKLKSDEEYIFVGKSIKNLITKDVIKGRSKYGIDMNIDGMVYAAIERCPVYRGKLITYDDTEARKTEGVIDIFPIPYLESAAHNHVQEGVAVIANSTWSAFRAKKLLRITWEDGEFRTASNASLSAEMDRKIVEEISPAFTYGDTSALLNSSDHEVIEARYSNPHQIHAAMEPLNATAYFKGETCEVWIGTQFGMRVTREVAKVTGLSEDKITTHILNSGGSFGRRGDSDPAMEVAYISKKIAKPVKLTWTREDDTRHDHYHPFQKNYYKAILNDDKQLIGFENHAITTSGYASGMSNWDQVYYFPNVTTRLSHVRAIIHQGPWRSVSEHSASLGKECFIDELAHQLNRDPLNFRLELLSKYFPVAVDTQGLAEWIVQEGIPDARTARRRYPEVLNYIKSQGLWNIDLKTGQGKGLAIEKFNATVCAHIVLVNLNDTDFGFRVEKVISVVHCGLMINPHFAKGQIEGGIIWALSALKYGGLEIEQGRVLRSNFHDNKVLRVDECPEIEVHFIESNESPTGLGEPGTPPLAPAVLNAIFNASGKRIRKIPVTKSDIDTAQK